MEDSTGLNENALPKPSDTPRSNDTLPVNLSVQGYPETFETEGAIWIILAWQG